MTVSRNKLMIIWIRKKKWQKNGQVYSRWEYNDREKEWMLCNVIFSFFTLNTSLFDFTTETWARKKIKLRKNAVLRGTVREILSFNSHTEEKWDGRAGGRKEGVKVKLLHPQRLWVKFCRYWTLGYLAKGPKFAPSMFLEFSNVRILTLESGLLQSVMYTLEMFFFSCIFFVFFP